MKNNNFGISEKSWDLLLCVLTSCDEIERASIFGSRAKGNYRNGSDVDIAIFGKNLDNKSALDLTSKLNEDTLSPYLFDIVVADTVSNVKLKEHIDRVGKEFFVRD